MRGNQQREKGVVVSWTAARSSSNLLLRPWEMQEVRRSGCLQDVSMFQTISFFFGDFYLTIFLLSFFCFFRFGGIQLHG
jgi:hypothetical protein